MTAIIVTTSEDLGRIVTEAVDRAVGEILRDSARKQEVLSESEAAEYLHQGRGTLRSWRANSRGPAFMKDKRGVRYHIKDLDAWLTANRVITSESPDAQLF
jgi:hypothetical protein